MNTTSQMTDSAVPGLSSLRQTTLFPELGNLAAWDAVASNPAVKPYVRGIIAAAEGFLSEPFPEARATLYMEFRRNGNRSRYEADYFKRRTVLSTLFLAEAFEGNGRFHDAMTDWIWLILGEPTWCLPAHTATEDPLPNPGGEMIDLFSAQTAQLLALIYSMGRHALDNVSPNLSRWIHHRLMERTIEPIEANIERFWWNSGRNNWTPWVCCNVLCAGLAVLDGERLQAFAQKLLAADMRYFNNYPEDGCCDEGVGYWNVSPAAHFLFCEQLCQASNGACAPFYGTEKFRRMAGYVADAWIGGKWAAPFADCPPRMGGINAGVLQRFGERAGSAKLLNFVKSFEAVNPPSGKQSDPPKPIPVSVPLRTLGDLFWRCGAPVAQVPGVLPDPVAPVRPDGTAWYPKMQVLFAKAGRVFLGAKGGNNGENHNHLDVGQFLIAVDDEPVILDLGHSEYTRLTFSPRRYENPILNSIGHNALLFGGEGQRCGSDACATDVVFREDADTLSLGLSLQNAYRPELGLKAYRREILFRKGEGTIQVKDTWRLEKPADAVLRLYSRAAPDADGVYAGCLALESSAPPAVETFELEDGRPRRNWGDVICRTVISLPEAAEGSLTLTFRVCGSAPESAH